MKRPVFNVYLLVVVQSKHSVVVAKKLKFNAGDVSKCFFNHLLADRFNIELSNQTIYNNFSRRTIVDLYGEKKDFSRHPCI